MDAGHTKMQFPNPRANANPFSTITFWWLLGLFRKGFKKELEEDDLYEALDEHKSAYLGDKLEKLWKLEVDSARSRNKEPSLLKVIAKCFGPGLMGYSFIVVVNDVCTLMTQPLLLGGLIQYFLPDSHMDTQTAYLYAAGIILCSTVNMVVKQSYMMAVFHIGMKMRVGLCSLLYRKALRLSKTALRETTVGQAVNLLSNDVSRFDRSVLFFVYLWFGPIQTIIIAYLVWLEIGFGSLLGIAVILLVIPVQAFLGKWNSKLRLSTAKRTDERIRLMNEIIMAIQVIKMYAWEKPFAKLVHIARKREIRVIKKMLYIRGFLLSSEKFTTKISVFIGVVIYVLLGNPITAEKMFVVTAYFNVLKITMTDLFPIGVAELSQTLVSVKRIKTFLLHEEISSSASEDKDIEFYGNGKKMDDMGIPDNGTLKLRNVSAESDMKVNSTGDETGINIANISAKWTEDLNENTLRNVTLKVSSGSLVAVIGTVGAGKSSLLHAILRELPLISGTILVRGTMSYASQEPWLFSASVRQSILFGQPFNSKRYKAVVRVCALERDFELFPYGDKTIVGERGVTLSGGQKARINLARAVYREADVYLLDDPLSAVDAHVGRHLFDDCICDFLKGKTRVLITHQLQYLHTADNIVILNNGKIEATGTFSELQGSGLDFAKQLQAEDIEVINIHEAEKHQLDRRASVNSEQESLAGTEPKPLAEMRTRGSVGAGAYRAYWSASGSCGQVLFMFGLCVLAQVAISGGDYWMSYWTKVEEQQHMDLKEHDMKWNESDINWMKFGSNQTQNEGNVWLPDTVTSIYIYTGIMVVIIILTLFSSMSFFSTCMSASKNLHRAMFDSISHGSMWFFNSNPSGQILNRFSKDMGAIDEMLPQSMIDFFQRGLALFGISTVVAVVNVWMLIPTAIMLLAFYLLRLYYVATSRSIKRLEAITRSPVFSHLSASLQGLTTIRAFQAQASLEKEFDNYQDLHSSSWYLFVAANRAFGFWLDTVCLGYIAFVTLSFLVLGGEHFGGDVGLAITQAVGLTGMLQWAIRQSAEMENQMTSVERVLEYHTVEKEPLLESTSDQKPPKEWPAKGEIEFDRVFLAYSKEESPVLKNICLTITSAEKVGIVGRTGAGKSSIISALFRLVNLSGGFIRIDGRDTASIGLHDLRSKISIIPQEPALFSGMLRENLDPFEQYSDAVLWSALDDVELKKAVEELPSGLSHKVSEGGSNFSVGQRQLLCLARAIIRSNKILVLDEATANVDPKTDELIQTTIRRKFADCTVLTIAHRLHTVIDSDRIIVMDAGAVVEFDHPYVLLQNHNSYFYKLVQETGHAVADSLFKLSQTKYESLAKKS